MTTPECIGDEMDKIDHLDIMSVMEGDGYVLEEDFREYLLRVYMRSLAKNN